MLRQHPHHLYRLVLLSLRTVSTLWNRKRRQSSDGEGKPFGSRFFDPVQRPCRQTSDRHDAEIVHTACTCTSRDSAVLFRDLSGRVRVNVVPTFRWLVTSTSPS